MTALRHAIFDLDGTLVDSLPGIRWSIEQALAECGLPPLQAELRPLLGPPIRSILAAIAGFPEGITLDGLELAFRKSYDAKGWRETVCFKGAKDLLWELLTGGVSLWIVTNKPAAATEKILHHLHLRGFFEEIVCRDSRTPEYESKAHALIDLTVRRRLPTRECILVGDTREDQSAAAGAGIECVIVPHGYGSAQPSSVPEWSAVSAWWEQGREMAEVTVP